MRSNEEQNEYEKELDEKAEYEEHLEAEAYSRQMAKESEWEAQMEHEQEVKDNPTKIIIQAIIEREEKGQLCPQTIDDLKILLNAIEVLKEL